MEKPIWKINLEGIINPILKLDITKKLSIEETRKRVYN